ncbi:MAG: hypothetical protein AAGC67_05165 [Myxococcota bacterium]
MSPRARTDQAAGGEEASRAALASWALPAACLVFLASVVASYGVGLRPGAPTARATVWLGEAWGVELGVGTFVLLQYAVATGCMGVAWWAHARSGRGALAWLIGTAVLARLLLVPVAPYTSNDVERYLWDGRVALEGFDPYRVSPDAPEVAHLRGTWKTPPEHAALPTLYPPAALATFALTALGGPEESLLAWKALCTAASLATLGLVTLLLRRAGRLRHLALIALSPLHVFEFGVGAHVDALSTLSLAAALVAITRDRAATAGAFLGLGALFKLLPLAALLPLACAWGASRRTARLGFGAFGMIATGYGATLALGLHPIGSLGTFAAKWRFGSPLFPVLETLTSERVAAFLLVGMLVAGLAIVCAQARKHPLFALQWTLALPLALSPVVFPWYLGLLVPLLALRPSAVLLGWTIALPLTYEVLNGFLGRGVWAPALWPLSIVTGAVLLGAGIDRLRAPERLSVPFSPVLASPDGGSTSRSVGIAR